MVEATSLLLLGAGLGLVLIGAAGLLLARNLFRLVLALVIAEAGANLLLVLAGYRWDALVPILQGGVAAGPMVDPIPQAMVLTAIVIGVGVQALALSLVIRVYGAYGTLDLRVVQARMAAEIDQAAGVAPPVSQERPAPVEVRS